MIVHRFCGGPASANAYLVEGEGCRAAVAIDPGFEAATILDALDRRGIALSAIINTHGHFDHVSGNRALREATGAPILMHRDDARLAAAASGVASLIGRTAEDSPPPDRFLEEGDEILCDGLAMRAMHTPGHTPGGISLLAPGLLFCGDLIVEGAPGRTALPGCSERMLLDSIARRILTLPPDTVVYPGHGGASTVEELRAIPLLRFPRRGG